MEPDYAFAEKAIFDRVGFPRMHFIEHQYAGDPTNWRIPIGACVEALLRTAGFDILGHPEPEVFVCRVNPTNSNHPARLAAS